MIGYIYIYTYTYIYMLYIHIHIHADVYTCKLYTNISTRLATIIMNINDAW